jgi:hypothetical protein
LTVITQVISSSEFRNGQTLQTLAGDTLTVVIVDGRVCFQPTAPDAPRACVVAADIRAGGSIVHVVDEVILPAGAALPDAAVAETPAVAPTTTMARTEAGYDVSSIAIQDALEAGYDLSRLIGTGALQDPTRIIFLGNGNILVAPRG